MNPLFTFVTHNGCELFTYRPWWEEGILHGMTLRSTFFKGEAVVSDAKQLCSALGAGQLLLLNQTHGDVVVQVSDPAPLLQELSLHGDLLKHREGDAIVISKQVLVDDKPLAYGISTADCVPIILRGTTGWGVVHAGWRGLANGIISKAVEKLGEVHEAVIFPAASTPRYEVGQEVVSAIGNSAVVDRDGGRLSLDTAATASNQLLSIDSKIRVAISGVCTLEDLHFHSFRRDGAAAGRCVSFVVPRRMY